jgi:hypothetical protein
MRVIAGLDVLPVLSEAEGVRAGALGGLGFGSNPTPPEDPSGAPPADDPMVNLHHPDLPWRLEKEGGGEPEPDPDDKPPGPGRKPKWPM